MKISDDLLQSALVGVQLPKLAADKDISVRPPDIDTGSKGKGGDTESQVPASDKIEAGAESGDGHPEPGTHPAGDPQPDVKTTTTPDQSIQTEPTKMAKGVIPTKPQETPATDVAKQIPPIPQLDEAMGQPLESDKVAWAELHPLDQDYLLGIKSACDERGIELSAIVGPAMAWELYKNAGVLGAGNMVSRAGNAIADKMEANWSRPAAQNTRNYGLKQRAARNMPAASMDKVIQNAPLMSAGYNLGGYGSKPQQPMSNSQIMNMTPGQYSTFRKARRGQPSPVANRPSRAIGHAMPKTGEAFDLDYLAGVKQACDERGIKLSAIVGPETAWAFHKAAQQTGQQMMGNITSAIGNEFDKSVYGGGPKGKQSRKDIGAMLGAGGRLASEPGTRGVLGGIGYLSALEAMPVQTIGATAAAGAGALGYGAGRLLNKATGGAIDRNLAEGWKPIMEKYYGTGVEQTISPEKAKANKAELAARNTKKGEAIDLDYLMGVKQACDERGIKLSAIVGAEAAWEFYKNAQALPTPAPAVKPNPFIEAMRSVTGLINKYKKPKPVRNVAMGIRG